MAKSLGQAYIDVIPQINPAGASKLHSHLSGIFSKFSKLGSFGAKAVTGLNQGYQLISMIAGKIGEINKDVGDIMENTDAMIDMANNLGISAARGTKLINMMTNTGMDTNKSMQIIQKFASMQQTADPTLNRFQDLDVRFLEAMKKAQGMNAGKRIEYLKSLFGRENWVGLSDLMAGGGITEQYKKARGLTNKQADVIARDQASKEAYTSNAIMERSRIVADKLTTGVVEVNKMQENLHTNKILGTTVGGMSAAAELTTKVESMTDDVINKLVPAVLLIANKVQEFFGEKPKLSKKENEIQSRKMLQDATSMDSSKVVGQQTVGGYIAGLFK